VATFAAGLRTPFARYWLSGFLADFGDGVRLAAFPLRDTAAVTCVPRLVQPDRLDQANARLIAGQIVGNELAGPAASGALFGLAAVLPFEVNAGTLGIAVLSLLTLPGVLGPPQREQVLKRPSPWHDFTEGLRWLWPNRDLRDVTLVAGLVSALDAAWFAVLVLYVVRDLRQQPGAYGLLLAIGALGGVATGGLGALLARLGPWRSLLLVGAPPLAVLTWRHRSGRCEV
jgi:hypothetical protein